MITRTVIPTSLNSKVGQIHHTVTYPSGRKIDYPTGIYTDILQFREPDLEIDETLFSVEYIERNVKNTQRQDTNPR